MTAEVIATEDEAARGAREAEAARQLELLLRRLINIERVARRRVRVAARRIHHTLLIF